MAEQVIYVQNRMSKHTFRAPLEDKDCQAESRGQLCETA